MQILQLQDIMNVSESSLRTLGRVNVFKFYSKEKRSHVTPPVIKRAILNKCAIQTVHVHHTKSVKWCGCGVDILMGLNIPKQALHHIPGWPEMLGIAFPSTDDVREEEKVGRMQSKFKWRKNPTCQGCVQPLSMTSNWLQYQLTQVTLNTQGQLVEPILFVCICHISFTYL